MSITNRDLRQWCVYWAPAVLNDDGDYSFQDAVEFRCRWIDRKEIVKDSKGEEVLSTSTVKIPQDVQEEGYLYLGRLADLDSDQSDNPLDVAGAYAIIATSKVPTMRARDFRRTAYLGK